MAKEYTYQCDCNYEGSTKKLTEARNEARKHLRTHFDKAPNWRVIIDQYDSEKGELRGRYWTVIKNI